MALKHKSPNCRWTACPMAPKKVLVPSATINHAACFEYTCCIFFNRRKNKILNTKKIVLVKSTTGSKTLKPNTNKYV